jgi:hypothetical protein
VEYPAGLVLACFVPAFATSQSKANTGPWKWDILLPVILALITCGLAFALQRTEISLGRWKGGLIFGVPLVVCYTFSGRPIRFGLGVAGLLLCSSLTPSVHGKSTERVRSFFGVHRIMRDASFRVLVHGNTEHGRQSLDPARRAEPLAYYSRSGPMGELFGALQSNDPRVQNVAVLGLGAGSLAAYSLPNQSWTFYEIDPAVITLARLRFTYLQDATDRGVKIRLVTGDARFQINRTQAKYGLIILDAFSSDSIPTHLFTREAFNIYRDRLTENGIIAVHYSSRYFDLRPVLGRLANAASPPFIGLFREDLWVTPEEKRAGKAPSKWAILSQDWHDPSRGGLTRAGWLPLEAEGRRPPWTDNQSNVLEALRLSRE